MRYPPPLDKPLKRRLDALWRTPTCFRGPPEEWRRRVKEAARADAVDFLAVWGALHRHFGIDPAEPGADTGLALALAGAPPVPAFTEPPRSGRPSKLGALDSVRLIVACDQYVREAYEKTGRRPARREVARKVAKQPWAEALGLSDDTIRDLLPELAQASDAYRSGLPTAFQEQFYNVVLPIFFGCLAEAPAPADEAE
jgi:hypothetical protein